MTTLENFDLSELRITNYYRNLLWHRTVILEGVRQVAWRNMAHLATITSRYKKGEPKNANYIDYAQGEMLKEQGLEDNKFNRVTLGLCTFNPFKLYLALLYAEVEFYLTHMEGHKILRDSKLDSRLNDISTFIAPWKQFRDGLLHANGQKLTIEHQIAEESQAIAISLQKEIDEYLQRVRSNLLNLISTRLRGFPAIQRLFCNYKLIGLNIQRMTDHQDQRGILHCAQMVKRDSLEIKELERDVAAWKPTEQEHKIGDEIAARLNDLSPSTSEQIFELRHNRQTAMLLSNQILPLFKIESHTKKEPSHDRKLNHLLDNISHYRSIIITAIILLNEGLFSEDSLKVYNSRVSRRLVAKIKRTGFQGDQKREIAIKSFLKYLVENQSKTKHREDIKRLGVQRMEEYTVFARVNAALLYEPLRVYAILRHKNLTRLNEKLEPFLRQKTLKDLRQFRNCVFHVQKPPSSPIPIDLAASNSTMHDEAGMGHGPLLGLMEFIADNSYPII